MSAVPPDLPRLLALFVRAFTHRTGFAPTFGDASAALASSYYRVRKLAVAAWARGELEWCPGRGRTLRVPPLGRAARDARTASVPGWLWKITKRVARPYELRERRLSSALVRRTRYAQENHVH